MKKTRIISILLVVALLLTLMVGCKRVEEQPQGGASSAPTATENAKGEVLSQGVSDTTIKVATAGLTGGAFAYIGIPAYDGFRACMERLNAKGGVRGRQIEVIPFDDQYDAATGKAHIERLVEQEKVFMFCSLFGNIVEPSLDYLKNTGIPVINISSGLDVCYSADGGGSLFQVQPANMTDARYLAARVLHESLFGPNKDQKFTEAFPNGKIGVCHAVDSASMSSLEHLKTTVAEAGEADRMIYEAVTQETYSTAIQKFKNSGVECVIFMGIDATTWISAMDDANWEVPVFFSYGASTLQSFVPDTYKPGRPCYATIWGDYSGQAGIDMLDDMMDALSYLDLDEATYKSYRDNNYCVAGYAYGIVLAQAFERYNDPAYDEYDLNWEDFIKVMEAEIFHFGAVEIDYSNGKRMGVDQFALVEYIGYPETGEEELPTIFGFETLDEIKAK